ncbi:voltage-dependent anion channel [Phyllosticta citriasiana]|uniref:Voltage-dependent anion channel n=1 Tax=Phyllosticta citriasiana TaxID=595635 RepID=A0ABR1KV50_9PEZI
MGTGAMAALMAQQPNSFEGVRTIGKIFFLLDIILFALFTGCIAFRFFDNPRAFKKSLHHPHESFFFGAYWVSIAFILYNMQEYGVRACGPWLVQTLEILYWIYVGCVLLVVVFQYHIIFDEEVLPVSEVMPAWLLPAYPFLILGPLSADLLNSQPAESGVPILIGGIMFAGFGWGIAFIMYTLYFTRLITRFLPTEPKRPGMYVAVGPAAYTANALVSLGMKAPEILPPDYLGITSGIPAGEIWRAVGVPAGIFVWLLGFWFFSLATISVLKGFHKMHFTLNYWSFVFPQAGLTIAAIEIGNVLESSTIKGLTSGMTILLVVAWIAVSVLTIKGILDKQCLWPGMDEDEEEMESEGFTWSRE